MDSKPQSAARVSAQVFGQPLALSILGASLLSILAFAVTTRRVPVRLEPVQTPLTTSTQPSVSRDVVRAAFFDSDVEPRIAETDKLNRDAAQRCVNRITALVEKYQAGVAPFVNDLTSVATRLGIVRRLPGDWWNEEEQIEAYVQSKFQRHLFSEALLTQDVADILKLFRDEVDANQMRMLVEIRASLNTADLPEVDIAQYEPFFHSVAQKLQEYSADQGTSSVYNGLTVLVASEIGSYVAISVAGGLLARFGTTVAAGAAAGAGVTAGATATGAGGGSLAGPVGTVVGFGVGLAVGLLIDWWMTAKFETELTEQMQHYLDSLRESLLHGNTNSTINEGGLADVLPLVCDRLANAYRERFYEQIVQVESMP